MDLIAIKRDKQIHDNRWKNIDFVAHIVDKLIAYNSFYSLFIYTLNGNTSHDYGDSSSTQKTRTKCMEKKIVMKTCSRHTDTNIYIYRRIQLVTHGTWYAQIHILFIAHATTNTRMKLQFMRCSLRQQQWLQQ